MNKLKSTCFLLLLLTTKSIAQTKVDSLDYYYQKKDFNRGIIYGEKLKIDFEKKGKLNTLNYAFLLDQIAELYQNKKQYSKSLNLYSEVLQIFILLNGENNKYVGFAYDKIRNVKSKIAENYYDAKKYKDAENIYDEILDISKSKINKNSKEYVFMLTLKGTVLEKQGNFKKAIEIYNQILEINNIDFDNCKTFSSIGMIYGTIADFKNSKIYFDKSLECNASKYGKNNIEYIRSLENIAGDEGLAGDYSNSLKLYKEAISLRIKNNFLYANTLSKLAYCYLTAGNFNDAEKTYLNAFDIYDTKKEVNDNDFLTLLYGLSEYYLEVGQIENSHRILKITTFLKSNLGTLSALENGLYILAWSKYYFASKNNIKAEENYLLLLNGAFHVNDFNDSKYKSNLALIYSEQGNHEKSIKLYNEAFELRKDKLGDNPRNDVSLLHGIASEYEELNNNNQAEYYYIKAFNLFNEKLTEDNPIFDDLLYSAAFFYEKFKFKNKSRFYLDKTFANYKTLITNQLDFQTNSEFNSIIKKDFFKRFFSISFLERNSNQYSEINIGCYENELLVKGLSLRNQQCIQNNIQNSGDASLKSKYGQFIDNKRQLVKLQELPLDKRSATFEKLTIETESLEKDLIRQSALFADAKKSLSITWKQIQEKLKPNEVAIDLVAFNYYNKKWTDSIVYAAFVVSKSCKFPKYISLFEQKQLESLLSRNKDTPENISINRHYTDKAISDLFLTPLENELEGIKTIYLSPSGLGHQIDFSALPVSVSQTLGEKYKLHILSSPSELMDYKVATLDKKSNIELLLYGGIDYNKSSANTTLNINSIASNEDFINSAKRSGIEKLPGTLTEVEGINSNAKINSFSSKVFKESEATEESIKALDARTTPYILHLATHGFFFPDPIQEMPKDNRSLEGNSKFYKASYDPMIRSGLLLAGAKNYWGKSNPNNAIEDGILTASEISNLDLSACQLVVLSACETGLGEIKGSEGVFGLQRAFKMAGVNNIIMSLWKVPDVQTAELFDIFYNECFAGKTIHDSFKSAQSKMKAKYSPYYWAGFVLLE